MYAARLQKRQIVQPKIVWGKRENDVTVQTFRIELNFARERGLGQLGKIDPRVPKILYRSRF